MEALLRDTPVLRVVQSQVDKKGLVKTTTKATIADVCNTLASAHVASIPVFDAGNTLVGVVDFGDVVAHVLAKAPGHVDVVAKAGGAPVTDVLSGREPPRTIPGDIKLIDAVEIFKGEHVRRLPVTNAEGEVVAMLTASSCLTFLHKHVPDRQDGSFGKTVQELALGSSPVRMVTKTQHMVEALKLMHSSHINAVAVVDEATCTLIGNMSMSDIKSVFRKKQYGDLHISCLDYIAAARAESIEETFPFYAVRESTPLHRVVGKLLATHVHHVYVVDEKLKPVRVIALSDILAVL